MGLRPRERRTSKNTVSREVLYDLTVINPIQVTDLEILVMIFVEPMYKPNRRH
jgi:hypothetical protein